MLPAVLNCRGSVVLAVLVFPVVAITLFLSMHLLVNSDLLFSLSSYGKNALKILRFVSLS